ncbi:MAG: hypothetical protein JWR37_1136 [Mycobacterium sp.]|jgi:hypothetical protein|nr:hypothetical protein [Mycobacterium sp.]
MSVQYDAPGVLRLTRAAAVMITVAIGVGSFHLVVRGVA